MSDRTTNRGSFGGVSSSPAARSQSSTSPLTSEPTDESMRAARRRWASGVAVLTSHETADETRRLRGATVSSFTVVSLKPPMVLGCLERGTATAEMVAASGVFAVSILSQMHEVLSDRFAGYGPVPDPSFRGIPYEIAVTGAPVLSGAVAWFDCRVQATHDGGSHVILVGDVVAMGSGDQSDNPLVSYDGAYRRFEEE